jgi:hypothetical protein
VLSRETEEAETGSAGAAIRNGLRSWPAADAPEEEEEGDPGLCAMETGREAVKKKDRRLRRAQPNGKKRNLQSLAIYS